MSSTNPPNSPPRAPPIKYSAPLGTRWQKEKAAAGQNAFDLPDDPKYVGPWVIGECVGKGASGRVKIAKHRCSGQLAAVKILPLQPIVNSRASLATQQAKSEKQRLGIDREITMMKLMNHPNIMRIYDVYEGDKELYLILEYVEGGELFDYLVNHGKLRPLQALAYFKQIVYGLNYAHTFSIIHRDLKPENILIHSFSPPLIKIADWGMAAFAPPDRQLDTSCGSPHYASPEIVNGLKYEGTATDIWSCGVILFALLTGRLPFDDKNVRTLLSKVKVGKYEVPAYVDPQAKDLISRMLVVDVTKRITMPEILAHPWLQNDTPGITYIPAPSLAELAQPLLSPAHIDRELLESLRVIWGKNADVEVIKADLLSAPGYGSLAKAFYFLIARHRECALQERGILMDIHNNSTEQDKSVMKPYIVPSPKPKASQALGVESIIRPQRLRPIRMSTAPPASAPATYEPQSLPPMPMPVLSPQRLKPASPAGPRPRPVSSPMAARSQSSHAVVPVLPVPGILRPNIEAPRMVRGATAPAGYADSPDVFMSAPVSMPPAQMAYHGHRYHDLPLMSAPPTRREFVHAPVPQYPEAGSMPALSGSSHPAADVDSGHGGMQMDMQHRNIDNVLNQVNGNGNALGPRENDQMYHHPFMYQPEYEHAEYTHPYARAQAYVPESPIDRDQSRGWVVSPSEADGGDKENRDRYMSSSPMQNLGGLGFAKVNAGNFGGKHASAGHIAFSAEVGKERRERRHRPPPLDFAAPPMSRRSTFSSSTKASPLMSPNASATLLTSPVVGEFKGWFSNLFSWKQSYILYSMSDVFTAQRETIRILEEAGIFVMMEDSEGTGILKCRMDDIVDQMGVVLQKSVRFRIEFSTIQGNQTSSGARFLPPQVPVSSSRMSSHASSMLAKNSAKNLAGMGYVCAIVLIQEKGAVSTFRLVYRRLRDHWSLEGIHSPTLGGGAVLMDGVQRVMN
ncbi:Pkinase-domain-containing protein [Neolentinus lepideus HHB14362 ss-1]|uniref:Pkinase-domain-containing protein n=1 Tax=Neolentinus lepideus HHB14362 ss-1 TaxID=1314782 RepID=A0A165RDE9_9AGAM|nr:Pkinase-domain-containing protein [Neolentinus lepideus HHB14362 ss-1]